MLLVQDYHYQVKKSHPQLRNCRKVFSPQTRRNKKGNITFKANFLIKLFWKHHSIEGHGKDIVILKNKQFIHRINSKKIKFNRINNASFINKFGFSKYI